MSKVGLEPTVSPKSVRSIAADYLPTMMYEGANYVRRPLSCGDGVYAILTCGFKPFAAYHASGGKKLTFINQCNLFCPWTVRQDDKLLGTIRKAGVCDNGCMYFCCSCCVCKEVKFMKFYNKDGTVVNTMRIYDGCLRKISGAMGLEEACSGCCAGCLDSCAYCSNKNMVVISEKFYDGDMEVKEPVGEIHQVLNLQLIKGSCCATQRVVVRHSVKSYENMKNPDIIPVISLLPIMQAGSIENPCGFANVPLVGTPSGSMFDCGRRVTVTRMNFADVSIKSPHERHRWK